MYYEFNAHPQSFKNFPFVDAYIRIYMLKCMFKPASAK